jgi:hypothetical protein
MSVSASFRRFMESRPTLLFLILTFLIGFEVSHGQFLSCILELWNYQSTNAGQDIERSGITYPNL